MILRWALNFITSARHTLRYFSFSHLPAGNINKYEICSLNLHASVKQGQELHESWQARIYMRVFSTCISQSNENKSYMRVDKRWEVRVCVRVPSALVSWWTLNKWLLIDFLYCRLAVFSSSSLRQYMPYNYSTQCQHSPKNMSLSWAIFCLLLKVYYPGNLHQKIISFYFWISLSFN